MANERDRIFRAFYRKLLTFYPRPFRERFGESMEQTFDDLCKEDEGRLFSLTLNLSIDTGLGIVKEHILHLSQRRTMSAILKNPKTAAVIGILLFLPGVLMLSLLILGIEPTLGPLQPYLQPAEGPHILGSLVVLFAILVLPTAGVLINVSATEGNVFKAALVNTVPAVVIGFLLVLPFVILESVYGRTSYSSFPFPLFAILWILPSIFIFIGMPVARNLLAGNSITANPVTLLFRVAFLVIIGVMWASLVNDQLPCFLGVPNCD